MQEQIGTQTSKLRTRTAFSVFRNVGHEPQLIEKWPLGKRLEVEVKDVFVPLHDDRQLSVLGLLPLKSGIVPYSRKLLLSQMK